MHFDMKGFSKEHTGKRLKIEFMDGEICEGELLEVSSCDEHADCCGIVFDLISTNVPERYQDAFKRSAWAEVNKMKQFEVLERISE
jgi:hypothetical protein